MAVVTVKLSNLAQATDKYSEYLYSEYVDFMFRHGKDVNTVSVGYDNVEPSDDIYDKELVVKMMKRGNFDAELIVDPETDDPRDFRVFDRYGRFFPGYNHPYDYKECGTPWLFGWSSWFVGDGKKLIRRGISGCVSKYCIDWHEANGRGRHSDGSRFWGIHLGNNKRKMNEDIKEFLKQGYEFEGAPFHF